MNHAEFQSYLLSAYYAGTLVTVKHDPNFLHLTWATPRSVLAADLNANLEGFLQSGRYAVVEHENPSYPATPKYWEIIPDPSSPFSVPASGVNPFTPYPSTALDRLVVVSGSSQGLHLYGEHSQIIQGRLTSGTLVTIGQL